MTRAVGHRLLAAWCLATSLGIGVYWVGWFATTHEQTWLPIGYLQHERVFVFTDTPLALLLVATAALLLLGRPGARPLSLFSAGMLAFLGIIDTAYFAQTGLFDAGHDGAANVFIVGSVLALAIGLVVGAAGPAAPGDVPPAAGTGRRGRVGVVPGGREGLAE